jgi:signal transduction histidine kinase
MRWAGLPSLRWKLVLALLLTSAASITGTVVALVPPLEHRITDDRIHALRQLARTSRFALAGLAAEDLKPGSPRLRVIAHDLARRTGGRVAVYDAQGRALVDTDPERRDPASGQLERLEEAGLALAGDVREGVDGNEAIVVTGVHTREGRLTLVLRKPLNDSRAAGSVVRRALPLAVIIGLAAAVLLGALMTVPLLRRVERLHRGARRLGDGAITTPLPIDSTRDEVGDLSRALETMRARLEAEETARQAFLSTASHELRTPVASLQGLLELLEEELAGPGADVQGARRRATAALRQSRRLAQLTTDLLDLSRLDGDVTLQREPVDLGELTTSILSEFAATAGAAGVELALERGHGTGWALADAPAVARIMRVLLDNALRYGADGGAVGVVLGGDDEVAAVRVVDRGTGLAEGEEERVFGRFARGQGGERAHGFGLGLPIGRGLARRMGGELAAERRGAPGATFVLTLPACAEPAGRQDEAPPHRVAAG